MHTRLRIFAVLTLIGMIFPITASASTLLGTGTGKPDQRAAAQVATGFVVDHTSVDNTNALIPLSYLDAGRNLNVLFNHMSIGGNMVTGLILQSKFDWPRFATDFTGADVPPSWFDAHHGLAHFTRGTNGDPDAKIAGFDSLMRGGYGDRVQVAMDKLGVYDLTYDPVLIWEKYRSTYLNLKAAYPNVTFVWFTMPVKTTNDPTINKYNTIVRKYAADPANSGNLILFDIAAIEADGIRTVDAQGNITSEVMNPAYTYDGVHLYDSGAMRFARAYWWLLARLSGWTPPGNSTPTPVPTTPATSTPVPQPTPTTAATNTPVPQPTNTAAPSPTPFVGTTVVDDLNDTSKMFAMSNPATLWFDTSNTNFLGGDTSRLARLNTNAEWATWQLTGMTQFTATAYFWPSETINHITFLASPNNATYTPVTPVIIDAGSYWNKIIYTLSLPAGTNYVRLVFPLTQRTWNPEIGQVSYSSAVAPNTPTPTPTPIPSTCTSLGRMGWTASSSYGGNVALAIDASKTTFWNNAVSLQGQGHWFGVDMGGVRDVSGITLDNTADAANYPRMFSILTSADGGVFTEVATASPTTAITHIDFARHQARWVAVLLNRSYFAASWSIGDFDVCNNPNATARSASAFAAARKVDNLLQTVPDDKAVGTPKYIYIPVATR